MNTLTKCKNCDELIDPKEYDCDLCEDCCYENQMSWNKGQSND